MFCLCLSLWSNFTLSSYTNSLSPIRNTTSGQDVFYLNGQEKFNEEMDRVESILKHERKKLTGDVKQFIFTYEPLHTQMNDFLISINEINTQASSLIRKHTDGYG